MSDHWDYYLCHVDDRPASIFLDMDLRLEAPIPSLPTLIVLLLDIRHPQEEGMPTDAEFETLCEIEDALTESLEDGGGDARYVGRVTCGGRRDFFFYTDNGFACETFLGQAMAPFADYEFRISRQDDEDWKCFRDFLSPTEHDEQAIRNRHVLEALEESGDDHEVPRPIDHWLFFATAAHRAAFQSSIADLKFTLEDAPDQPNDDGEFSLHLSRVDPVTWSHINDVTIQLYDLASEHSGKYDGWGTSVETE